VRASVIYLFCVVLLVVTAVGNLTLRPVLHEKKLKEFRPVESDKWFLDPVCAIRKISPLIRDPTHHQSITVSYLQFVRTEVFRGRCSSECCIKSRKAMQLLFRTRQCTARLLI
jgi:hypothetical protein